MNGQLIGKYRFGLYTKSVSDENQNPIQIIELIYKQGQSAQIQKFTNLNLGTVYYVYELDDNGRPICEGEAATVAGKPFLVTYAKASNEQNGAALRLTEEEWSKSAIVYNQINYQELPQTGGIGAEIYKTVGLLLLLTALCGILWKRRGRTE